MNLNKITYTETLALESQTTQPIRAYAEQANTIEVLAPVSGFNTAFAVLQGLKNGVVNPALRTTERLFMSPLSDEDEYRRWNFVIPGSVLNDNTLANSTGLRFKVEFWYISGDFIGVEKYNTETGIADLLATDYPDATNGQYVRVIDTDTDWVLTDGVWEDFESKKTVGINKEVTQVADFQLEKGVFTGEPTHAPTNTELILEELSKMLRKDGSRPMTDDLDMDGNAVTDVARLTLYSALGTAVITFDGAEVNINIGGTDYKYAIKNAENTFSEVNTFVEQILAQSGIDLNNSKIVNLADGTNAGDAVNKGQLDLKANQTDLDALDVRVGNNETNKADITYVDSQDTALDLRVSSLETQSGALDSNKVPNTRTIMSIDLVDDITRTEVVNAIGEATTILSGLMSATDKSRLNALYAVFGESADTDTVVNTINEILAIFENYPEGADLVSVLADKVDKVEGKQLSTNDLTDVLKSNYDTAYTHSQVTDGSNPHQTTFANITNKPNTLEGYNILNAYNKEYINTLESYHGWQKTDLTPTALTNGDTIATATLQTYDKLLFVCKDVYSDFINQVDKGPYDIDDALYDPDAVYTPDLSQFGQMFSVEVTNGTYTTTYSAKKLLKTGDSSSYGLFDDSENQIESVSIGAETDGTLRLQAGTDPIPNLQVTITVYNYENKYVDSDEITGDYVQVETRLEFLNGNAKFNFNATNSTFVADIGVELKIYGFNIEEQEAKNINYDPTDDNYITQTNVEDAMKELDTQVKVNADAIETLDSAENVLLSDDRDVDTVVLANEQDIATERLKNAQQDKLIADTQETLRKINTGEPTDTAQGTDVIHLGKDVANAELNVKAEGLLLDAEQEITNGDFESDIPTISTLNASATHDGTNGYLVVTGDGGGTVVQARYNDNDLAAKKLYIASKAQVTNALSTKHQLFAYDVGSGGVSATDDQLTPTNGTWYMQSIIYDGIATSTIFQIRITTSYDNTTDANGAITNYDFLYIFDVDALTTRKQYSPLYRDTFDNLTDNQIQAQMDSWVQSGTLPNDIMNANLDVRFRSVGVQLFDKGQYATSYAYLIPIKPSTQYTWSESVAYKTYNIDGTETDNGTATTHTTANNEYYIAFSGITDTDTFMLNKGATALTYEPYIHHDMFVNGGVGYSIGNTKDSVDTVNGKLIKYQRIGTDDVVGVVSVDTTNYPDALDGGVFINYLTAGGSETGTIGTDSTSGDGFLTYELAEPIETELQPIGNLIGSSGATVYVDNVVQEVLSYSSGLTTTYDIATIEKLIKINSDGSQTEFDTSDATLTDNQISNVTGATDGDLFYVEYKYTGTHVSGLTTITYYDNRNVLVSPNGTVYKIVESVDDSGNLTRTTEAI
jgi:hypothetical protein